MEFTRDKNGKWERKERPDDRFFIRLATELVIEIPNYLETYQKEIKQWQEDPYADLSKTKLCYDDVYPWFSIKVNEPFSFTETRRYVCNILDGTWDYENSARMAFESILTIKENYYLHERLLKLELSKQNM